MRACLSASLSSLRATLFPWNPCLASLFRIAASARHGCHGIGERELARLPASEKTKRRRAVGSARTARSPNSLPPLKSDKIRKGGRGRLLANAVMQGISSLCDPGLG